MRKLGLWEVKLTLGIWRHPQGVWLQSLCAAPLEPLRSSRLWPPRSPGWSHSLEKIPLMPCVGRRGQATEDGWVGQAGSQQCVSVCRVPHPLCS